MNEFYARFADWYPLLDPLEDHDEECQHFGDAIVDALGGSGARPPTLLELGSGGGHNAWYLSKRFTCTLTTCPSPCSAAARPSTRGSSTSGATCAASTSAAPSTPR